MSERSIEKEIIEQMQGGVSPFEKKESVCSRCKKETPHGKICPSCKSCNDCCGCDWEAMPQKPRPLL